MFWFAVEVDKEHATTLERSIVETMGCRPCTQERPVVPVVYVRQNDASQQFVFNRAALDVGVLSAMSPARPCDAPQPIAYKRIV